MSGGQLVVLDRGGRDVKRFPLAEGLATLGSDPACDIRIMLPTVSPHHATVVVHANQTVVRNVCADATLVNGRAVSVAALRHGDVIGIGGRALRWDYAETAVTRAQAPEPALHVPRRAARAPRRVTGPAQAAPRDPQLQRALEMSHRASMPGSAGGKQVAIVQPQRRDTTHQIDKNPPRTSLQPKTRPRTSKSDLDTSVTEADEKTKRKSSARLSPKSLVNLQPTTKATLWIESRKSSPRKGKPGRPSVTSRSRLSEQSVPSRASRMSEQSAPSRATRMSEQSAPSRASRMSEQSAPSRASRLSEQNTPSTVSSPVLRARRASASAKKSTPLRLTVLKRAQSASKMRVTKIEGPLVMDHTKQAAIRLMTGHTPKSKSTSPSFVVKRPSPVRRTPRTRHSRATRTSNSNSVNTSDASNTPSGADRTVTILEITESVHTSRRSGRHSPRRAASSPRKSALKDPTAKRGRKTESIKFDLSNLETTHDTDVLMLTDSTQRATDDDVTLRYSSSPSPSPRRSIHSRSSRMLRASGVTSEPSVAPASPAAAAPAAPSPKRSSRGSLIVQKALNDTFSSKYSGSDATLTRDLESYSIVDLVSIDDNSLSTSAYGSAVGTLSSGRKTRSTIDPTLLGSSTPYASARPSTRRSRSDPSVRSTNNTQVTVRSSRSTRSKSSSTPENSEDAKKHISVNSTRISRASRSRSRLTDTSLPLDTPASPRSSRRVTNDASIAVTEDGVCTPENRHSPEEASTPVLSIQSLLDSSQSSFASQRSTRKGRSFNNRRKTTGGITAPKIRVSAASKSTSFRARKSRLRLSSGSAEIQNKNEDEIVTPKSAVKLVPEGVKNKHSTAKKPQSKRSIIDDLNESDIVKQLFNSPVKRKLSQSMTQFSQSAELSECFTPERFVSPIGTPERSPSLEGIKRMFADTTPDNDLRDVRGVKQLLRTPRARKSIKNDLTNVSGVKKIFAKSPKNRLSDVRVKEVFALSPSNDLRRVTGVKSLFRTTSKRKSPRNELDDVRGVKRLFTAKSPANDLRNVAGVKRTLRRHSPKNELNDMRGVKRAFQRDARNDLSDVSGVEELFNLSNHSSATVSRADSLFDQLLGKPPIKAVYSKTFTAKTANKQSQTKPLHASLDQITATDDDWLQRALNKRLQIKSYLESLKTANSSKANRSKANKSRLHASLDEVTDVDVLLDEELNKEQQINHYLESMRSVNESKAKSRSSKIKGNRSRVNVSKATSKANISRELQKLVTDTVEGDSPLCTSRVRSSTLGQSTTQGARKKSASELYSAHTLPIKKRSFAESSIEKPALPLKKRVVVHSTPVKGHVAMSVSLARVSPIRAHDDTRATLLTSTRPKETTEARPKSTRGTRATTENAPELAKPSPRKTRGGPKAASPKKLATPVKKKAAKTKKTTPEKPKKASPAKAKAADAVQKASPAEPKRVSPAKAKKASPVKAKNASPAKAKKTSPAKVKKVNPTEAKKASPTKAKKASPAKAKKASPVKPKKATPTKAKKASPAKSKKASPPKPKASLVKELASPVSVKTTRSRRKDVSTLQSNTKKRNATLVVTKKSPVMSPKPRETRKRKQPETSTTPKQSPKKTRATRKNESIKVKTPKNTRTKVHRASLVVSKPSPQLKPRATRKADLSETKRDTTRNTRKTAVSESPKKSQAQSNTQAEPKTRGRKTAAQAEVEKPQAKTKKARVDEPVTKTKNNKLKSAEEAKPTRSRRKQVESQEIEAAPSARSRRAKTDSVVPQTNTRKRKSTTTDNEVPPKVRKSKDVVAEKGKKRATDVHTERNTRKKEKVKESKDEKVEPVKATRGRKAATVESAPKVTEQKTTRGRKANIESVPVTQVSGKRKRAATEPSPVKERKTRATRGNTQPEGKPSGRSRRR